MEAPGIYNYVHLCAHLGRNFQLRALPMCAASKVCTRGVLTSTARPSGRDRCQSREFACLGGCSPSPYSADRTRPNSWNPTWSSHSCSKRSKTPITPLPCVLVDSLNHLVPKSSLGFDLSGTVTKQPSVGLREPEVAKEKWMAKRELQ